MGAHEQALPLGQIVASCTLTACVPMVAAEAVSTEQAERNWATGIVVIDMTGPYMAYYRPRTDPDERSVDVTGQRPYGDYAPGRWAWILDDIKPTTEQCPACFGTGNASDKNYGRSCLACGGDQRCDPIPARGRQKVWNWEPAA